MTIPKKFKDMLAKMRKDMDTENMSNLLVVERPNPDDPPTFMLLLSSNPGDIASIESYYEMMKEVDEEEG